MKPPFPALAFLLALTSLTAIGRPVWPESPVGTGAAAFGGGGSAHAAGVGSLFVNPAALQLTGGLQLETGMMGLTDGLAPYALFGFPVGMGMGRQANSSFALGYSFDRRAAPVGTGGPARQGLLGGGAWTVAGGMPGDVVRLVSLGAAAHTFGNEGSIGVDLDAGARARLWRHGEFGVAAHNILESGVGQKPEGYQTRRSYLASAGLAGGKISFWKMRILDPEAAYEFRGSEFRPSGFVHAVTLGAAFIQEGVLGLRATALLPHTGSTFFAGGFNLKLPLGNGLLGFGYAFVSGSGRPNDAPSHSFSLNLSTYGRADRLAPQVAVQADRPVMHADGGEGGAVHFQISASDRAPASEDRQGPAETGDAIGRLQRWSLTICAVAPDGRARNTVRAFSGKDLPPRLIRWDGTGEAGAKLPLGYYAFSLSAQDASGNQSATAWQLLQIAAAVPPPDAAPSPKPADSDTLDLGTVDPSP